MPCALWACPVAHVQIDEGDTKRLNFPCSILAVCPGAHGANGLACRSLFRAVTLRSGIGLAQRFRVEQQGENLVKKGWNLDVSSHMLVLVHQESTRMCREVVEIDQSHAPSLEIGDID